MLDYLTHFAATVAGDVWTTVVHNWPYLVAGVIAASLIQVDADTDRLSAWMRRRRGRRPRSGRAGRADPVLLLRHHGRRSRR
ncbi:MAG: hypothetical protein M0Z51_05900, partial [Propionibacterium sp.]|nr:hypothetical protein [Propionibacterium sp.]